MSSCVLPCSHGRTLRSSFLLLLLVSTSWLFGLLAVNHSILAFHYLHAGLCGLQVTLASLPLPGPHGASAGGVELWAYSCWMPDTRLGADPRLTFTNMEAPGHLPATLTFTDSSHSCHSDLSLHC